MFNFVAFMFCLNTSRFDYLLTQLKYDWSLTDYSDYLSVQRICREFPDGPQEKQTDKTYCSTNYLFLANLCKIHEELRRLVNRTFCQF